PLLEGAFLALLARTPLTDLASCARTTPGFVWQGSALGLVSTGAGRALAARALARVPAAGVDAALGKATSSLLASLAGDPGHHEDLRRLSRGAVALLADRAVAAAAADLARSPREMVRPRAAPSFAAGFGAMAARRDLSAGEGPYGDAERAALAERLKATADAWLAHDP